MNDQNELGTPATKADIEFGPGLDISDDYDESPALPTLNDGDLLTINLDEWFNHWKPRGDESPTLESLKAHFAAYEITNDVIWQVVHIQDALPGTDEPSIAIVVATTGKYAGNFTVDLPTNSDYLTIIK